MDERLIAIHEAGHAVAQHRLNLAQGSNAVSILATDDAVGTTGGEGSWYSEEEGQDRITAYCAGYAALIAAGYEESAALMGTDGDFENAEEIIKLCALPPLKHWLDKAVVLMMEPANIKAVERVSRELLKEKHLNGDAVEFLIDVADGELTEADWEKLKDRLQ